VRVAVGVLGTVGAIVAVAGTRVAVAGTSVVFVAAGLVGVQPIINATALSRQIRADQVFRAPFMLPSLKRSTVGREPLWPFSNPHMPGPQIAR
jgi:hypothetical protein